MEAYARGDVLAVMLQNKPENPICVGCVGVKGAVHKFNGFHAAVCKAQKAVKKAVKFKKAGFAASPGQAKGAGVGAAPACLKIGYAPPYRLGVTRCERGRHRSIQHTGATFKYGAVGAVAKTGNNAFSGMCSL